MSQSIEAFNEHMPVILTLGSIGLKDRHWEKISEIVGFPIYHDGNLTLAKVLSFNLDQYVSQFETISDYASKEIALENKLFEMVKEWNVLYLNLIPYKYV